MDPENPVPAGNAAVQAPDNPGSGAAPGGGEQPPSKTARNAAVGVAGAAGVVGGFSLEPLTKLGVDKLILDHTAYSVGILALVLAFILVTGRATLKIPPDTNKAIGHMTAFCAAVAVVSFGFYFVTDAITHVTIQARVATNAGYQLDEKHLLRLLDAESKYEMVGGDSVPIVVDRKSIEIDVGALYAAYVAAKASADKNDKQYQGSIAATQHTSRATAS